MGLPVPLSASIDFILTARTVICRVVNAQRQCAASMSSDECRKRLDLGDIEDSKHIMAEFSIRFDIGTRTFLVWVYDNFTPVFWDGA